MPKDAELDAQYCAYLAARIRAQDQEAFTELYGYTYSALSRYAKYFLKGDDLIQDVLQETYIAVWRGIGKLKMDTLVLPWMRQIVCHTCCDMLRVQYRRNEESTDFTSDAWQLDQLAPTHDNTHDRLLRMELEQALQSLPHKERQAFTLRYQNDLKLEEVADFMNISLTSAKRYIQAARLKLQKQLSHLGAAV